MQCDSMRCEEALFPSLVHAQRVKGDIKHRTVRQQTREGREEDQRRMLREWRDTD